MKKYTSILDYYKDTDNKEVWAGDVEGVTFSLYIPRWRIPDPIPSRIVVEIFNGNTLEQTSITRDLVDRDPTCRSHPIIAFISKESEHRDTIKYKPVFDSPEIGKPYIPHSHTFDKTEDLTIRVSWIMS